MNTLKRRVVKRLLEKGMTIATAESCTGGGVAKLLTDVPGVSEVFRGGVVSYQDEIKIGTLGVAKEIIEKETAVSGACAKAMAEGVRKVMRADVGVSTTGYAGPTGENVGLVFVGCATEKGTEVVELHLTGNRSQIRKQTEIKALELVEDQLN